MFNEIELLQKNKNWIISSGFQNIEYQNGTLADYFGMENNSDTTKSPQFSYQELLQILARNECIIFLEDVEEIIKYRYFLEQYDDYYIGLYDNIKIGDYLDYIDTHNRIVISYCGVPFSRDGKQIIYFDKIKNERVWEYTSVGAKKFKKDLEDFYGLKWDNGDSILNGPYSIKDYENLRQKFKQEKRLVRKKERITL